MRPIRSVVKTRTARRRVRRSRGFTLMETALATVIIGVGVLAVVQAQQTFLQRNNWSTNSSTATYLANEIREMSQAFPRHDRFTGGIFFTTPGDPATFTGWGPEAGETVIQDIDDLDDLDGAVFGSATNFPAGFTMTRRYPGPVNAFGDVIPETLYDGTTETFTPAAGPTVDVAMRGWTQIVQVTKVDPFDMGTNVGQAAELVVTGQIVRRVDRFPVRVTVTVLYAPDANTPATEVTSINWVTMP